jgi:hypothetical protein
VNLANDSPLSVAAFAEPAAGGGFVRDLELRRALHVTYAYLWYLRWELGITDWGVADDLGYDQAQRWLWDDSVPDELERHLPPIPYLREGRRLIASANMSGPDVNAATRGTHRFEDSVMLGHYFTDAHGCPFPGDLSQQGNFEVPLGVFLPVLVDGFLPGMPRAGGVDRIVASAVRLQPDEIWGGQVVGVLAGLAANQNVTPRQVDHAEVQRLLTEAGWTIRLPVSGPE